MGDARFEEPLHRVTKAADRADAVARLSYDELVRALGAASRSGDPYLANILTSERLNRSRRGTARVFSAGLGVAAAVVLLFTLLAFFGSHPHNFVDHVFLLVAFTALAAGAIVGALLHSPILRRLMRGRA